MKALPFLMVALFLVLPASADTIKIATWNIENLQASPGKGRNPRNAEDFLRLKEYAALLNADVVVLQEIENEQALAKVFDPDLYQFFVSRRKGKVKQRTAFAIRIWRR